MSPRFHLRPASLLWKATVWPAALIGAAGLLHPAAAQENEPADQAEAQTQVSPIIADDDFLAAIPKLEEADPELGETLESIEEFERRFEAQSDPQPAASQGQASGIDPELGQPLARVEDFELIEVIEEPSPPSADEGNNALRYQWRVTGLEKAGQSGAELEQRLRALSTLERGDGKAANVAMIAARLEDDKALLVRLLKAEGWYRPTVEARLEPAENRNAGKNASRDATLDAMATLEVEPGERFVFSGIRIEAGPTIPKDLIARTIRLAPGDPIIASDVLANEALIAARLPENGYPFARIGQRDILLDADSAQGVYTLPVETGPRARVSGFAVSGDATFEADHIAEIARITPGDMYDTRYVDDLRRALAATGLLRAFSVEPQPTGETNPDGTEAVTLVVDQTAGPARTLAGTVGYGTGQGFRLEGSWSHRNLFPPEGALTAALIAGTREQGASLAFRRANSGARDRSFELGISALRSDFDAFNATTGRIGALYSYVSTPIWQKRVTWAVGAEALASVEEAFNPLTRRREDQTYLIGALTGQVGYDTSDDLLDPTRGFRLEALIQPEGSLDGGFTPYLRAVLDGSAYAPVRENLVLAGRARVGTIQGASRLDIAPSRRLYAGGGGSVRGFGFQELGPQVPVPNAAFDPNDPEETADPFILRPIGGRSVIEASAEARYRFGDYGVVAFVDAGQVYRDTVPQLSDIRFGVGIGGRIYTSFGPLRVDLATPINRRTGESAINVYVSIGQAF